MKIHIYAKLHEQLSVFKDIIDIIKSNEDAIFITTENRRAFRELENVKTDFANTVFVISSLNSLGLNDSDIAGQLAWFVKKSIPLVICNVPSTYEFGVSQPMNKAVLSTILQSLLSDNKNVITVSFKRSNSGRSKLPFPDNWDELYIKWQDGKISSKHFIELSGLKKATFYNLLSEYKRIQSENTIFLNSINLG